MKDIETLVDSLTIILKNNVNTKITAINTEKGDFNIDAIDNNAYYFGLFNEMPNFTPFIVLGFDSLTGVSNGNETIQAFSLTIDVALQDDGDNSIYRKLLRYNRVIREIIEDNWQINNQLLRPRIIQTPILAITAEDGSLFQVSGLIIEGSF